MLLCIIHRVKHNYISISSILGIQLHWVQLHVSVLSCLQCDCSRSVSIAVAKIIVLIIAVIRSYGRLQYQVLRKTQYNEVIAVQVSM